MRNVVDDFDDYFIWLCACAGVDLERYSELMLVLYFTEFIVTMELDDSRRVEGLMLREEFYNLDKLSDWVMFMDAPCTVLEAMVGIARRLDGLTTDENCGDRTSVWFWEMIGNLGLKRFTNQVFEEETHSEDLSKEIYDILFVWMNRDFDWDGRGSAFPISNPEFDQRYRTIMYQMYDYVDAYYDD